MPDLGVHITQAFLLYFTSTYTSYITAHLYSHLPIHCLTIRTTDTSTYTNRKSRWSSLLRIVDQAEAGTSSSV